LPTTEAELIVKRILVGVDASPASVQALERAADEARMRDATLEVVHAFNPPDQSTAFPVLPERGTDKADLEAEREKANAKLGRWLEESEVDLSGLNVEWSVLANNRATEVLIDRSADADLVVVGSRGRGGFRGLLLGSTSEQVTRHAKCPVLVVRDRRR
jgi:nucleotide-binding universal stress UspA family protein